MYTSTHFEVPWSPGTPKPEPCGKHANASEWPPHSWRKRIEQSGWTNINPVIWPYLIERMISSFLAHPTFVSSTWKHSQQCDIYQRILNIRMVLTSALQQQNTFIIWLSETWRDRQLDCTIFFKSDVIVHIPGTQPRISQDRAQQEIHHKRLHLFCSELTALSIRLYVWSSLNFSAWTWVCSLRISSNSVMRFLRSKPCKMLVTSLTLSKRIVILI